MKRILAITCGLLLAFSLAACGTSEQNQQPTASSAVSAPLEAASGELADLPGAPPAVEAESGSSRQPLSPSSSSEVRQPESEDSPEENTQMKMNVQIGNNAFIATLEENAAADALVELMEAAPVVIEMSDYAGFEKVGPLGTSLPASDRQTTTGSGDIVLYNGNQIVLFYGSNAWSYTRLGRVDDLTGWEEALGSGDVTAVFSISSG